MKIIDVGCGTSKATFGSEISDLMTFRDQNTLSLEDDLGNKKEINCNERRYVPSEIAWLLKTLGFTTIDIFGAKRGHFRETTS
jgi:hypothetical protein